MPKLQNISLYKTFLIYIVIVAVLSIASVGYLWILSEKQRFAEESDSLRKNYLETQKETLKLEVDRALAFIDYKRSQTEKRLKDDIKSRVYEAHDIAMGIYHQEKSLLDVTHMKDTIREALRPIRFNKGRGYYFAFDMNGVETLFADKPEMEGKSMMQVRGGRGELVVPDMLDVVREQGEGFYTYLWSKPDRKGYFPKIAFVKLIAPIGWVVGTGEYLDDVEKDIQEECLHWISNIRFGGDGYIFVGQMDGLSLSGPAAGKNMHGVTDVNGVRVVQELIAAAKAGGGFVHYVMPKFGTQRQAPKISYAVGVKEWQWYIGAGVHVDEVEETIAGKQSALKDRINQSIGMILAVLSALLIGIFIVVRVLSGRIHRNLTSFAAFFRRAAVGAVTVDINAFSFQEFTELAESANEMVEKRKAVEAELSRSEQRFRELAELLPQTVFEMDATGRLVFVNRNAYEVFGYTKEDFAHGINALDMIAPPDRKLAEENIERFMRGDMEISGRKYTAVRKDGRTFPVLIYSSVSSAESGGVGLRGIAIDISHQEKLAEERDRFREQYLQTQKIEAIGRLAGGIAHDLNNMLSPILGYGELLINSSQISESTRGSIEKIHGAGLRAKEMVRQLLAFSRKQALEIKTLNVNNVLSDFQGLLRRMLREDIQLQLHLAPDLPDIRGDVGQIEQVIMNIAINAQDAMPGGGKLCIETRAVDLGDAYAAAHQEVSAGPHVMFALSDTGHGMDAKTQARIFEPFFTTKGKGKGTGLGLATVFGIVKQHNGNVWVYSEPGRGTTFKIYFPIAFPEEADAAQIPEVVGQLHGTETIVIAEDDESVRELAESILRRYGYDVLSASGGHACLRLLKEKNEPVDLLLTDVVMSDTNGKELFHQVRELYPDVKVLYMSGYTDDVIVHHGVLEEGIAFIQKPFAINDLAAKVRTVLDGDSLGERHFP